MQREPLAPQKVSQTLLLPFVISLIASQCAPDPSLFFFSLRKITHLSWAIYMFVSVGLLPVYRD